MREQLVHRLRLLGLAFAATGVAALSLTLFVVVAVSAALVVVWAGIPMLVVGLGATRWEAQVHRRYAGGLLGIDIAPPYLRRTDGNLLVRTRALLSDPATRRDVLWLFCDGTVGLVLGLLGIVQGVLAVIFWWIPPDTAVRLHARLSAALLQPAEKSRLALRVEQLTESRAETVDTQAAELRRIERDLHDGAQARLVALGMSLALAEDTLERDPDGARALLGEARAASSTALAELRDLVRGIHPPVLADRGLVGAIQALALAAPIPVQVRADLRGRLPAPVESAAYFAAAEALTNVIKHSGASSAQIGIRQDADALMLAVRDDGHGGADPASGTGLRGIERRLSAFDGTLGVQSPAGGPTELTMVLPCASSSPRILPSSGTG